MKIKSVYPFEEYTCYKVFHKKEKRFYVQLVSKVKRTTISFAKFILSVKLGRILTKQEEVDHIDNNKLNDNIENLQILTKEENKNKYISSIETKLVKVKCYYCDKLTLRTKTKIVSSRFTFCSVDCKNKFYKENNNLKSKPVKNNYHGTKNGYSYHKCRCEKCRTAHNAACLEYRISKTLKLG